MMNEPFRHFYSIKICMELLILWKVSKNTQYDHFQNHSAQSVLSLYALIFWLLQDQYFFPLCYCKFDLGTQIHVCFDCIFFLGFAKCLFDIVYLVFFWRKDIETFPCCANTHAKTAYILGWFCGFLLLFQPMGCFFLCFSVL